MADRKLNRTVRGKWKNPTVLYLEGALRAEKRVEGLLERAARYRSLAERVTGVLDGVRVEGSGGCGPVEQGVLSLVALSGDVAAEAKSVAEMAREVKTVIERVEDRRYRDLLAMRYLDGYTWNRIAEAMGFEDVRHVYRLHGEALIVAGKMRDVIVCHV